MLSFLISLFYYVTISLLFLIANISEFGENIGFAKIASNKCDLVVCIIFYFEIAESCAIRPISVFSCIRGSVVSSTDSSRIIMKKNSLNLA